MNVLLVENSSAIQQSFGALLRAVPTVAIVGNATDVASALKFIGSSSPDLIVLDAQLHGNARGIDLLRFVRQHHPRIRVVILSHFGWATMRKVYLDAGALAYFDKAYEFQHARDYVAELANAEHAAPSDDQSPFHFTASNARRDGQATAQDAHQHPIGNQPNSP